MPGQPAGEHRGADGHSRVACPEADMHVSETGLLQQLGVVDAVEGQPALEHQAGQVALGCQSLELVGSDDLDHVLGGSGHPRAEIEFLTIGVGSAEDLVEERVVGGMRITRVIGQGKGVPAVGQQGDDPFQQGVVVRLGRSESRKAHHLVLVVVRHEAEVAGDLAVQQAERVSGADGALLEHSDLTVADLSHHGGEPLGTTIADQERGVPATFEVVPAHQVRDVVRDQHQLLGRQLVAGPLLEVIEKRGPAEDTGVQLAEALEPVEFRLGPETRRAQIGDDGVDQRVRVVPGKREGVDLVEGEAGVVQAPLHGVDRELRRLLLAVEPLLLDCGYQPAVDDHGGGGVMAQDVVTVHARRSVQPGEGVRGIRVAVVAKDDHSDSSISVRASRSLSPVRGVHKHVIPCATRPGCRLAASHG